MSGLLQDAQDSGQHEPTHPVLPFPPSWLRTRLPRMRLRLGVGSTRYLCAIVLALPAPSQKEHPGPAVLPSNSRGARQQQQVVTIRSLRGEGSCAPNSI